LPAPFFSPMAILIFTFFPIASWDTN
jgi:hypothetical protein